MKVRVLITVLAFVFVATPLLAQGPPATSGLIVVRGDFYGGDYDYWYVYTDWKRGYVAFHGVDISSWCAEDPTGYTTWNYQENYPPAEEGLIIQHIKADDVTTSVWPASIWDGNWCDNILNSVPLATGTVDLIYNDNDVLAWMYDHNRKNAYGVSAHGVLSAPDGERMIFNGSAHGVYDADVDEVKWAIKIVLN